MWKLFSFVAVMGLFGAACFAETDTQSVTPTNSTTPTTVVSPTFSPTTVSATTATPIVERTSTSGSIAAEPAETVLIDDTALAGYEPVVLPLADGSISIVYGRDVGDYGLATRLARCSDATCTDPSIIELTDGARGGGAIEAVLLPDGSPVIAFTEFTARPSERVVVVVCGDVECTTWSQVEFEGFYLSNLSVGPTGTPLVGLWQWVGDHYQMKSVECGDRACADGNIEVDYHTDPRHPAGDPLTVDGAGFLVFGASNGIGGCADRECSNTWSLRLVPNGMPGEEGGFVDDLAIGTGGFPLVLASVGVVESDGLVYSPEFVMTECLDQSCRLTITSDVQRTLRSDPPWLTALSPAIFLLPSVDGSQVIVNAVTQLDGVIMSGRVEVIRCIAQSCSGSGTIRLDAPTWLREPTFHAALLNDGALAMAYTAIDRDLCGGLGEEGSGCEDPDSLPASGLHLTICPNAVCKQP